MCLLLETIQLLDGKLVNLDYHNHRFNAGRRELTGNHHRVDLAEQIRIPDMYIKGLFRCRILYDAQNLSAEFVPYHYRNIRSLKLVVDNTIDYHLKFADRSRLETLFAERGLHDDIIIVKNNCITDSYVANLVFFDGSNWFTPDTPLLRGTQREALLDKGVIREMHITPGDLPDFEKAGLINAFSDLMNMPVIPINQIFK